MIGTLRGVEELEGGRREKNGIGMVAVGVF